MTNDVYVAFLVGCLAGLVVGIACAGIMAAISNNIERNERSGDEH